MIRQSIEDKISLIYDLDETASKILKTIDSTCPLFSVFENFSELMHQYVKETIKIWRMIRKEMKSNVSDQGHIYVIATPEMMKNDKYKIGYTSKDIKALRQRYNTYFPDHILILYENGTRDDESKIKKQLSNAVKNSNKRASEVIGEELHVIINCIQNIIRRNDFLPDFFKVDKHMEFILEGFANLLLTEEIIQSLIEKGTNLGKFNLGSHGHILACKDDEINHLTFDEIIENIKILNGVLNKNGYVHCFSQIIKIFRHLEIIRVLGI